MANYNKVVLVGRLVRDPEVKELQDNSITSFGLAVNDVYYDKSGEKQENTSYFDCEMFGKRGKIIAQFATKGRQLLVEGKLKQDRWEARDGSGNRSKVLVRVDNFEFLDSGASKGNDDEKKEAPKDRRPAARGSTQGKGRANQDDDPPPF